MRLYNSTLPTLALFGPSEEATCHFCKASVLDCPLLEMLCKLLAETLQLASLQEPPTDNPPGDQVGHLHTHSPHSMKLTSNGNLL